MNGLVLLLGVGAAGILLWSLSLRSKKAKWSTGDELYIWSSEESKWGKFTILEISDKMYLVGEGWYPNIIDQNWLPISDFDELPAYKR